MSFLSLQFQLKTKYIDSSYINLLDHRLFLGFLKSKHCVRALTFLLKYSTLKAYEIKTCSLINWYCTPVANL